MNEKLRRDQLTKLAIPKGELLADFLRLMTVADFNPRPIGQSELVYELSNLALPLLLVAIRPRDIGPLLNSSDSQVSFGFTCTDIAVEQELVIANQFTRPNGVAPAKLVIGSTPNWREQTAQQNLDTLRQQPAAKLMTPYPRIAQAWTQQEQLANVTITEVGGATEAFWWLDNQCLAILDVIVTGRTFAQNDIREVSTVMEPIEIAAVSSTKLFEFSWPKLNQANRDAEVCDDLLRKMKSALRGKDVWKFGQL